ncbi:50S ribosomal protein L11 methyltransferase [Salinisphaera hydrothermalis]|uniref:Ribosomal protein L11 methyltransferase n=1 Tax=Salinisphaera hydrothermalis (strain C41B8) TaxID=1304275 RepID=A0A084IL07_SALHC|nr:50S ribosomal protein L11 methyltransferase [Salinisphaera hydrothermalis]KEZ77391.1 ribosomal protein L11 methyltransferase [Salinisphaera hydrothermalis C41B8]
MSIAWLQITVTTHRTQLAEAVFEQFDAEAVTELDAGDDLTVEESPNSQPAFQRARVVGLFTQGTLAEPIVAAMTEALGDDVEIATETLENQDWASAWLAEHPPLVFGDRLWIAPHSAEVDADDDAIIVRLDPGLAFGTGTHPTTRLCLQWLAAQDLTGRRVVDYGCGSGILAIAAARLGATEVVAVDIDDQAVRATRENAARNDVSDVIQTPPMDAIDGSPFDIVLANILAKPLIALAPTLTELAAPGAPVVLAGLLTRQIDDVMAAYDPAFTFEAPVVEDDWARLVGQRAVAASRHRQ